MPTVQISNATYVALELAGRLTGLTASQVVERLVADAAPATMPPQGAPDSEPEGVVIYADYNGVRFKAAFDRITTSVTLIDGRLAGSRFKSPSAAARAVVESERPNVDSNRNGWTFWTVDDGSGRQLQALRD